MAHNQEKYLFKIKKEIECVVCHTVFAVYDISTIYPIPSSY